MYRFTDDFPIRAVALVAALAIAVVVTGLFLVPGEGTQSVDATEGPTVEDVSGGTDVTVTYSTAENRTRSFSVEAVDPAAANPDQNWAYLPRSSLPQALEGVSGDHDAGVVPIGEWVLVGDLVAASSRVGAANLRVVAPAGMNVDPARKAGFLSAFVSPYDLAPDSEQQVTLLIAPNALPSSGRMYGTTGYVTQHAFWDGDVSSVWIHEFVHARQTFALSPEMAWFREGSATYLSARLLEEQFEGVTEADVRERLAAYPNRSDVRLARTPSGELSPADYERGVKLLYVVDAEIRRGSDGEHTLIDVFRTMNEREGPVTIDEFVRIVERRAGTDQDWIRQAVTEPGDLDPLLDDAGDVFDE